LIKTATIRSTHGELHQRHLQHHDAELTKITTISGSCANDINIRLRELGQHKNALTSPPDKGSRGLRERHPLSELGEK
jgi:hypothetical protein